MLERCQWAHLPSTYFRGRCSCFEIRQAAVSSAIIQARARGMEKEKEKEKEGIVCVTGGSGFIGSWLVRLLLERGYAVNATVKDLSNVSSFLHSLPSHSSSNAKIIRVFFFSHMDFSDNKRNLLYFYSLLWRTLEITFVLFLFFTFYNSFVISRT